VSCSPGDRVVEEKRRRRKMRIRKNVSPLQRLMATILSVFLSVGLGLIGPASALADGVERGGLSFTIVSDDITKTATGSVPETPEGASGPGSSTGDTSTGGGSTGDTSTGDTSTGDTSTGDTSTGDTSTGDTSTADTSTGDTSTSTADTSTTTDSSTSGASSYNTSESFNNMNDSNSASGKNEWRN
jgi:hypothetical protein